MAVSDERPCWVTQTWLALTMVGLIGIGACSGWLGASQRDEREAVAAAMVGAANAAMPLVVARFRADGREAILRVKADGGSAEDAERALAAVEARYAPFWAAWQVMESTQAERIAASKAGRDPDEAALLGAYCGLRQVSVEPLPNLGCAP